MDSKANPPIWGHSSRAMNSRLGWCQHSYLQHGFPSPIYSLHFYFPHSRISPSLFPFLVKPNVRVVYRVVRRWGLPRLILTTPRELSLSWLKCLPGRAQALPSSRNPRSTGEKSCDYPGNSFGDNPDFELLSRYGSGWIVTLQLATENSWSEKGRQKRSS